MSGVVFVDIETTGLDPERHEPWDIAVIDGDTEHVWHVKPDLSTADPTALRLTRYHERVGIGWKWRAPIAAATEIARVTAGKHLAGAVVSFDALRLETFLRRHGQCPSWHYHLIDVEALAAGFLAGRRSMSKATSFNPAPPWDSDELTKALGLSTGDHVHEALADARWAKAIYEAVLG